MLCGHEYICLIEVKARSVPACGVRRGVRDSRPKFRLATTGPAGVPAADGVPSTNSGFAPRLAGVCCACELCGVPAADGVPGEKSCCRGARDGVCCGRDAERVDRLGVPF